MNNACVASISMTPLDLDRQVSFIVKIDSDDAAINLVYPINI